MNRITMTETNSQILIIEDDEVLGGALRQRMQLEGFDVIWATDCNGALNQIKRQRPAYIVSDIVLPDGSGEDLFRMVQPWLGETPILFVTAFGEIDQAVRLVKAGAVDYVTKPYDVDQLLDRIRDSIGTSRKTHKSKGDKAPGTVVIPSSDALAEQLRRAGQTDLPVLLTGETGVGKEVAARYLHSTSPRRESTFVAVNCAAIPKELMESQFFGHAKGAFTGASDTHVGYFEEAGTGILFLDEIGELDAHLQAALLRVLEDGRFRPVGARKEQVFQGRIVAATNADLLHLRQERHFRDDLYYRLSVLEIHIAPLRERRSEILDLANAMLRAAAREKSVEYRFAEPAVAALLDHDWPGNIRELRNRLQRALVFASSSELHPEDIFPEVRLQEREATLAEARRRADAEMIEKALAASGGRVTEAAKSLGISRTTLWKRRGGT